MSYPRFRFLLLATVGIFLGAFVSAAPLASLDELRQVLRRDYDAIIHSAADLRKRSFPADRKTILIKPSEFAAHQVGAPLLRLKPNFIAVDRGTVTVSVGTIENYTTLVCVYAEPGLRTIGEKEVEAIGFKPVAEEVGELIHILRPPKD